MPLSLDKTIYQHLPSRLHKLHVIAGLFILLASTLYSSPALSLPFINSTFNIIVKAPDAPELEVKLQKFLQEQQSTNEQLKQIKNQNKYAKLLSAITRKKMEAEGYYDFGVSFDSSQDSITFAIQPGTRAIIKDIKALQPIFVLENIKEIAINDQFKVGSPLLAAEVLAAQKRLEAHINQNYCFVSPKLSRSITMNTITQEVEVFFNLETEQGKDINEVQFQGNKTINSKFLANIIRLKPGCFKSATLTKAQVTLLQSGLLTSATPEIVHLDENQVNIIFKVSERKHRTQSIGVGYSSDEGTRLNLGWENRNWRGNGKRLSTQFKVSQLVTQLDGEFRVPQFKNPDLDLLIQGEIADTTVEAFDAVSAEASALLEYSFTRHWIASIGIATEYSQIESTNQNEVFRLLSFPLSVRWDTSNNLLDPSKGKVATFAVQPFIDLTNTSTQFTQFASSFRYYVSPKLWSLNQEKRKSFTLATKLALGSIRGEALTSVPADERYYIGGGGSVRGFDYQSLSPEEGGIITGGLSFLEVATEIRMRFNKHWGGSIFVDGGVGFTDQKPDFSERLSLGGGFGIRYITSFAPIRLDIAWPLSSPMDFETKAQLYVGLKQAF